jgi:hypothetical protein
MKYSNQEREEKYKKYNQLLERDNLSEETEDILYLCIENLDHEEALDNMRALRNTKSISRDVYELTTKAIHSKKQEIIDKIVAIRTYNLDNIEA